MWLFTIPLLNISFYQHLLTVLYMLGIVLGTTDGGANNTETCILIELNLLLCIINFCLIVSSALKILRSFAIFLIWLIFYSLIMFIFLLRFLDIYFTALSLPKNANGDLCKAFIRISVTSYINVRDTVMCPEWNSRPGASVKLNSRMTLNKVLNHPGF